MGNEIKMPIQADCFANYFGYWLLHPAWLETSMFRQIPVNDSGKGGVVIDANNVPYAAGQREKQPMPEDLIADVGGGVAVVSVNGTLMKGQPKFGGTSTILVRRALSILVQDPQVNSIVMMIDSPGGHVAGTQQLADTVRAVNKRKPVLAHIEDLGASAAYWIASQAQSISMNRAGMAGSIGTYAVVTDQSEQYKNAGVKTYVVGTGAYKGAFAPGTEITSEQLDNLRREVADLAKPFLADVKRARKLTDNQLASVSDGSVFVGENALKNKLVDNLRSIEATIDAARAIGAAAMAKRRKSAAHRAAKINIAENEIYT